jgi:hypothetical protein
MTPEFGLVLFFPCFLDNIIDDTLGYVSQHFFLGEVFFFSFEKNFFLTPAKTKISRQGKNFFSFTNDHNQENHHHHKKHDGPSTTRS